MVAAQLCAVTVSLLVLAAHLLRDGGGCLFWAALALVPLLFLRRPWVARTVQLALVVGTLEWIRTLVFLYQDRVRTGQGFLRMTIILGIVTAVTFSSAFFFQTEKLNRLYGLKDFDEKDESFKE
jgi:hypothetical protein